MSVSNPAIGPTRSLTTSGLKQIFMKSTDETNYLEAQIDTMAFHDCIAGLGQEPDQATQEIGGSQAWRDNTNAPFPGQATYVTAITSINASIACNTLSTTTQTVRLVGQTILPIFDNSISMWDDVVAASVAIGDLFITATDAQLKGATNSCTDCTAILPASTSSVTYYQPQLMSSDYYCVGSDGDPLVPKIFIAWNIGTTYF